MKLWCFLFADPEAFAGKPHDIVSARVAAPTKALAATLVGAAFGIDVKSAPGVVAFWMGQMDDAEPGVLSAVKRGARTAIANDFTSIARRVREIRAGESR